MSEETRQQVVDALVFQKDSQRTDLLNPDLTNTNLIALLQQMIATCKNKILITCVRSDHHDDGPNGHAGGYCVDCWNADWETAGDSQVTNVIQAAANSEYCWSVGLAGYAQGVSGQIKWPGDPFYWFEDSGDDHVHVAAKSQSGGPGVR